jgi:CDP-glucose 4,6-dehydratase
MTPFGNVYKGRRVLLTGNTGFKGSWLALWLSMLGAKTTGLALDANTTPSHWSLLGLDMDEKRVDVRDARSVAEAVTALAPEVVFHLAAQPLVRRSYQEPLETWSTNVLGTAHVLDACRGLGAGTAVVVITTDKCYRNREWDWGYRENDELGGRDPYSASKAAAELVVSSYRDAFFDKAWSPLVATARAGNVIGGGDWSEDRLIPDAARSVASHKTLEIRSPNSTRPWQHVLESLSGYLRLGQKLIEGHRDYADSWNFGPDPNGNRTVEEVLSRLQNSWPGLSWRTVKEPHFSEATLLFLDSSKARRRLGWRPVWSIDESLKATADWYAAYQDHGAIISLDQLDAYVAAATRSGLDWTIK